MSIFPKIATEFSLLWLYFMDVKWHSWMNGSIAGNLQSFAFGGKS